jgi:excisionase family DNA binding protein
MAEEEVLTVAEVAKRLRVHPVTLRAWLKAGKVHGVRMGGTRAGWRIPAAEVERVLRQGVTTDDAPKMAEAA